MFKPISSLLESDPRFCHAVSLDLVSGISRTMRMGDLHSMMAQIELSSAVPTDIRDQFDTARNVFVYSWFVYEFATLAEQQCFAALESALRRRLFPTPSNESKSPGLSKLLKMATEQGYLLRKEFEMPSSTGMGELACSLDFLPMFRNHVAHGNIHLLPQGSPDLMRLCQEVIDKLFSPVPIQSA